MSRTIVVLKYLFTKFTRIVNVTNPTNFVNMQTNDKVILSIIH